MAPSGNRQSKQRNANKAEPHNGNSANKRCHCYKNGNGVNERTRGGICGRLKRPENTGGSAAGFKTGQHNI
eukprot:2037604-Ditylum_brightwellii.AAC.1